MTEGALHLDSVAAIIWQAAGPRYLLQHREDRTDIAYPNWWSLFGGALEASDLLLDVVGGERIGFVQRDDFRLFRQSLTIG